MMKLNRYLLGLALLVVGTMPVFSQVSNDNEDEVYKIDVRAGQYDFVPGQVLVKFKDESPVNVSSSRGKFRAASISAVDAVLKEFDVETMDKLLPNAKPLQTRRRAKAYNGEMIEEKDLSQLYFVKTSSLLKDSTMMLIDKLNALDEVEFAEPNYKVYVMEQTPAAMSDIPILQNVPNVNNVTRGGDDVICANPEYNPLYSQQWGIKALNINALWNKPIINSRRPVIAILDTGVDINHPDLKDNIWTNPQEGEGETAYDDDKNGFVDDLHGWNFVDRNAYPDDKAMHGTHVAGIAAAVNNTIGIVGANPMALIMPVKVLNDAGQGNVANLIEGINYAAENGADVINMSLGGGKALSLKLALEKAYMTSVLVASAGNMSANIYAMINCSEATSYPAGYSIVLGVQATDQSGNLASFTNYDPDGPMFSKDGVDGRNYELRAPGVSILSTLPGGKYSSMCGTSMSAPLISGAISALKMVKEYVTNDVMNGDLMHLNCDFAKIVSEDTPRYPYLDFCAIDFDDSLDGGNDDGQIDVGETVGLYPTLVSSWATAKNIKLHLDVDEYYKDKVIVTQNDVALGWSLSAYGRAKSNNPLIIKVDEEMADETTVNLFLTMTADDAPEPFKYDFPITIHSTMKVGGILDHDTTFTADKNYIISTNLAIPEGVTLIVEPGTKLRFKEGVGMSNNGKLVMKGTPEKPIILTCVDGQGHWDLINGKEGKYGNLLDTLEYCKIEYGWSSYGSTAFKHCVFSYSRPKFINKSYLYYEKCNFIENTDLDLQMNNAPKLIADNIVNNSLPGGHQVPAWPDVTNSNYFNYLTYDYGGKLKDHQFLFSNYSSSPTIIKSENPSYLGTSNEKRANTFINDIDFNNGFAQVDLSNMRKEPVKEAHGIVWKVLVNDKDAQDEYDQITPLGVGQHKFEVYFNRPMNKAKAPNIAFGLRSPYTQHAVNENGSWNEEGTIYTAYFTVDARTQSDGLNRIYVDGAEDNEYFECPYENLRFNFPLQSAGAMATGFEATPGLGSVVLRWNNDGNDFSDAMGFNVYRYTVDEDGKADTIRINNAVLGIETNDYTDYEVKPGEHYYYLYKVLSTDLQEYDVSNVVTATPLTASKGDANGDSFVDVADVTSTVGYIVGQEPKPFVFDAADMNEDLSIDVLDVVGIVNKILNPSTARMRAMAYENAQEAVYTIEDGVLYIEAPVALAGLQLQISVEDPEQDLTPDVSLKGFEQASTWLSENDYRLLIYNIGSRQLAPGKHAVLTIGDAEITSLRLCDRQGGLVRAVAGENTTAIKDAMGSKVQNLKGVYNLNGQKLTEASKLQRGVYIINGQKIIK